MQKPESTTEIRRGGGEARVVVGSREEEDGRKGENEERPKVMPIYKGGLIKWARKTRRPNMVIQLLRHLDFRDGH